MVVRLIAAWALLLTMGTTAARAQTRTEPPEADAQPAEVAPTAEEVLPREDALEEAVPAIQPVPTFHIAPGSPIDLEPLPDAAATSRWMKATGWITSTTYPPLLNCDGNHGCSCRDVDACFDGGVPCGVWPDHKLRLDAEFLLFWISRSRTPPLVTTGSPNDPTPGAIGQPGTQVLDGGSIGNGVRTGGRFGAWYLFGDSGDFGLQTSFLFLGDRGTDFSASSNGTPGSQVLTRPFFNSLIDQPFSVSVAFPGVQSGTVSTDLTNTLVGMELNATGKLLAGRWGRTDMLVGYRFTEIDERLTVNENLAILDNRGIRAIIEDDFDTRNYFHGGQLGFMSEVRRGRFLFTFLGKVALGSTLQVVNISGETTISDGSGASNTYANGVLAQPTNSGRRSRKVFGVMPEVGLNVKYDFTDHLRGFFGYRFLYWSDVARPGQQIDDVVNPSQLPTINGPGTLVGPADPQFRFVSSDFWAQGMTFGFELLF
ncbi:hypothetical protein Pan216_33940 [Planctomycetes bacterium Pan216]|uniref:BBP7 family outer membrane beta-barrel protein n=1 Tax=Kolteria novifilia TaxID=2527975 RepID=A0A518B6C3_9BACT|nr:hypothetical protein Pan216_33940 [Planctomycetes bacterium Pan216]